MSAYSSTIRSPKKRLGSSKESDNVGEMSVELDVESLIEELEHERPNGVDASGNLRKRLDEILDRKRASLEVKDDFDDIDIDD